MRNSTGWVAIAVAVLFCPMVAEAQNLVQNAGFDAGLSSWYLMPEGVNPPTYTSFWGTEDAQGLSTSGSALVTAIRPNQAYAYLGTNCQAPPAAGAVYTLGGALRADVTLLGGTYAHLGVQWRDSNQSCFTGSPLRTDYTSEVQEGGPWTLVWTTVTAPPGTTACCVVLEPSNSGLGSVRTLAVHVDRVFLGSPGTGLDLIFRDGFEGAPLEGA